MIWERRLDMASALGAAFVIGWLSSSGYYSITNLWKSQDKLVTVETKVVPQLQTKLKQADCDKVRYVKAAIQGALANSNPRIEGPEWSDLTACPKVAPVKPPPIAQILPRK